MAGLTAPRLVTLRQDEDVMIPENVHLNIGSLLFEDLDQIDLTGAFEVLSRLPNATHRIYAKSMDPVRDVMGLRIVPDVTLAEAPQLDILHVPGGPGQQALMEDKWDKEFDYHHAHQLTL